MVNGNTSEFVDNLYYGAEMYFTYNNRAYFIQGWVKDGLHYLVLDYNYEADSYEPKDSASSHPLWEYSSEDSSECVQAFLDAPLWDGKNFYEVEKDIVWTDL